MLLDTVCIFVFAWARNPKMKLMLTLQTHIIWWSSFIDEFIRFPPPILAFVEIVDFPVNYNFVENHDFGPGTYNFW